MEKEIMKETKSCFSRLGLQLFLIAILIIVIQIGSVCIVSACAPDLWQKHYSLYFLAIMLPFYIIGIPGILRFMKQQNVSPALEHRMSPGQWMVAFCITYSLMYVSNLIGIFLTRIIGILKGAPVDNVIQDIATDLHPLAALLCMVILAPIFEELVFRKFIIDRTAKYGEGVAIFVSALSFGLFHGNLNQFAYAFSLGLFWGFLYVKTRKIKYTIWLHMVINFMGSVVPLLILRPDFIEAMTGIDPSTSTASLMQLIAEHATDFILYLVYSLFIFVLVITGIVLFFVNRKKMHLSQGEVVIPKGERFRTVILNAGMLLNIIFWCTQIVIQLFQ